MRDDERGERSALDWAREAGLGNRIARAAERRVRRRRALRGVTALAALAVLAAIGYRQRTPKGASAPERLVSEEELPPTVTLTQPLRRVLPDGSAVILDTGASIAIDFSGAFRRVALTRGEARFEAAKDARRPFVVSAGNIEVRAVGTAFAVDLEKGGVDVLVTEGRVAVDNPNGAGGAARGIAPNSRTLALVDAGNRVRLDASTIGGGSRPVVVPVSERELREEWR